MAKFITFEGGEGAGKSTQVDILAQRLAKAHDVDVVVTREPGGTPLSEKIRELILGSRPAAPETEFLLFAAARAEHVALKIAPALAAGRWVICDRFIDSTRVYQGYLGGVSSSLIEAVEAHAGGAHMPDVTVILDVPADLSIERARARGSPNRYDAASREHHQVLREGFLMIAKAEPGRCVVVDGARSVSQVADDVFDAVSKRLLKVDS